MPNSIKYNVSTETLALKKGNFWIGTGDVGKGPTSSTGYYNGITPPAGGYTIYLNKETSGPSIYTVSTESQLVSLTNTIGVQSFTTSGQCLNWFATQTDKMVFNIDYPAIVTDGLAMNIDASFTPSYPTINTVLYDVSPRGNNGVLINGPTFGTTEGVSCFKLDGIDDRIDVPKDLVGFTHNIQYDIDWTIECWMYMYTPDATPQTYKYIYGNYNGCNYDALKGNAAGFSLISANEPSNISSNFTFGPRNNPGGSQCPGVEIGWNNSETAWVYASAVNKWCDWVMTSDDGTYYKIYVNGVQQGSTKTVDFKNSQSRIDNNLTATSDYSWGGNVIGYNQVDFTVMRMYNKPLSQSEIIQNYQAMFPRFLGENIVTSGLVLYLDAGYPSSYPTTGTTWYDVSGYGNNGTLVNGPTYNSDDGGSIVFDGVDDYVDIGYKLNLLNNDITQEAWVNANSFINGWHGIISNMPSWGTGFSLQIGTIQNIAAMVSGVYLTTSWTPSLNVWYHIVATHRSSDNLNVLYVNGVQENTVTREISYVENAVTKVGLFYTYNGLPFSGDIDVVRSYNRALTSSEVLQNYNAQKSRFGL